MKKGAKKLIAIIYSLTPGPDIKVINRCTIKIQDYIPELVANKDEDGFEPRSQRYYKSDKFLGVLYRVINEKKV